MLFSTALLQLSVPATCEWPAQRAARRLQEARARKIKAVRHVFPTLAWWPSSCHSAWVVGKLVSAPSWQVGRDQCLINQQPSWFRAGERTCFTARAACHLKATSNAVWAGHGAASACSQLQPTACSMQLLPRRHQQVQVTVPTTAAARGAPTCHLAVVAERDAVVQPSLHERSMELVAI